MVIYKNTSLDRPSNFVAVIDFYFYVFNMHSMKKHSYTSTEVIFNQQLKLHEVTHQPQSLGSFTFQKAWIWGQESAFKRQERNPRTEGNATVFCMISA